jgi:hypothetical protein
MLCCSSLITHVIDLFLLLDWVRAMADRLFWSQTRLIGHFLGA